MPSQSFCNVMEIQAVNVFDHWINIKLGWLALIHDQIILETKKINL